MQCGGVKISTTLLVRHQCQRKSFIHMDLLNKVDASRLGAVEVCVYVTDRAPPCDLDAPPPPPLEERVTQDTRAKNMQLGARTPPPLPSLPPLSSLNCSHQPVGGYPIGSLRVVAVLSHLFIFLPVSQLSLPYPRGECVPCQFY